MKFSSSSTTNIRSEVKLLLCCARTCMDAETEKQVKTILRKNLDWEYLIQIALEHRIMPLLYHNLNTICPDAVPSFALNKLQDYFNNNTGHNLFLTGELLKLLDLFENHGIPVLPFKGPVLADFVYKNIALRQFVDLDILVHKQDVHKAKNLLLRHGYQTPLQLTEVQEAVYLQHAHHYKFIRDDNIVFVELHWAITQKYFSFAFNTEHLWKRLKPVSFAGNMISSLSPDDLLLILCVHGFEHCWYRLSWLCDVAELIRVHQKIDWEWVFQQAGILGSKRILSLGLFLAKELLSAPLPKEIVHQIEADSVMKKMAWKLQQRILHEADETSEVWKSFFFHIRMRERLRDKFKYCFHRFILTPRLADLKLLTVQPSFFSLYYILRPVRMIKRYGLSLLKYLRNSSKKS